MNVDQAVELCRAAVMLTLVIGTPVMVVAAAVGLVISLFQALTQIQDQTISFVPKIIAMILALLFLLPWIMTQMMDYSTTLYQDIPKTLY